MAIPEEFMKIAAMFQRSLKREDFEEIDVIPLAKLKLAKAWLLNANNFPYYSLLESKIKEKESVSNEEMNIAGCGPLGNPGCNQKELIKKELSDKKVFLDIPYTSYEKREKILREVIKKADLIPIVAKDKLTSNVVLCKVCRIIQSCKYGLADISFNRHSVTYELGLMHGFGKKICILLQENSERFSDINGLEHHSYNGEREFKIKVAKWLKENVTESNMQVLDDFIKEQETLLKNDGEVFFSNSIQINDFKKQVEESKKYSANRFNTLEVQYDKYFYMGATPIPLKDEVIDTGEEKIKNILNSPKYKGNSGWNMNYQADIKPNFEGLEKSTFERSLKFFRNGYLEFHVSVNEAFALDPQKSLLVLNPYAIIEFPVSFIKLLKEIIQKNNLPGAYFIRMSYMNCGNRELPDTVNFVERVMHNKNSDGLNNWTCERPFEALNMSNDEETFYFMERLYNTFGYSADKIPFFDANKMFNIDIKK